MDISTMSAMSTSAAQARTGLLRDMHLAVAAGGSGRAGVLPALRRGARVAPPSFYTVHLGARHRCGDLLHPGKHVAGAQYDHAWFH